MDWPDAKRSVEQHYPKRKLSPYDSGNSLGGLGGNFRAATKSHYYVRMAKSFQRDVMSRDVGFELVAFLVIAVALVACPVFGTVETVNISPSVLVVGQPITFSGVDVETISPNNPENLVLMYIYPGFGCSFMPSNAIAFTTTSISSGGTYSGNYNTTLSFPVPVATSTQGYSRGWAVTSQSYQNELPSGQYSVGVTDTEASTNGAAGMCKNFTVISSSPIPEFSDPVVVMCSALAPLTLLLLVRRGRKKTHSF
jgi:hypothetical protein